jgi:hypothetical protein
MDCVQAGPASWRACDTQYRLDDQPAVAQDSIEGPAAVGTRRAQRGVQVETGGVAPDGGRPAEEEGPLPAGVGVVVVVAGRGLTPPGVSVSA